MSVWPVKGSSKLTQDRVVELFKYNPLTGELICILEAPNRSVGDVMNQVSSRGYYTATVDGYSHHIHRIIWLIVYGHLPLQVDHIDHNRLNNRLDNLRDVTPLENKRNCTRQANNTSGFTGVHWCKRDKRWVASVQLEGRKKALGNFKTKEEAISCRKIANIKYGFHINHGKIK